MRGDYFMNSKPDYRREPRQNGPRIPDRLAPFLGMIVFAEVVIAVITVVGFFLAISQPFGWQSGLQILLFASMAILLWLADANIEAGESAPLELSAAYAHRDLDPRETSSP
jgi:hypothetical protein